MMKLLCKTCRESASLIKIDIDGRRGRWYFYADVATRESGADIVCAARKKTCCCKLIEFYIFVWLEIYKRRQWLCPSSRFFARSSHALGVVVFFLTDAIIHRLVPVMR
jgi:hypothetical protein